MYIWRKIIFTHVNHYLPGTQMVYARDTNGIWLLLTLIARCKRSKPLLKFADYPVFQYSRITVSDLYQTLLTVQIGIFLKRKNYKKNLQSSLTNWFEVNYKNKTKERTFLQLRLMMVLLLLTFQNFFEVFFPLSYFIESYELIFEFAYFLHIH